MMTFYFICFLVGLIFSVLSFIFSGAFEADVDMGADVGADLGGDVGGDFGHDIAGHDVGVGEVHFPLFSPIVIASFLTAFGGSGIVGLHLFPFLPVLSLAVAVGGGVLMGLVVGLFVRFVYKRVQANAVTSSRSLVGQVAEVTEAIPASSIGQISFSGEGSRLSGPARCEENRDIKRHAMVTIVRVVGGLYYVREHVDEKLRDVSTNEKAEPEPGKNPDGQTE